MNMMPSRHGWRALVTRPRAEAAALAEALDRRGIEAIIEPLLDIHYRDEPAPDLAGVQAVLCTSANGVRALARRSGERRGLAMSKAPAAMSMTWRGWHASGWPHKTGGCCMWRGVTSPAISR